MWEEEFTVWGGYDPWIRHCGPDFDPDHIQLKVSVKALQDT